MSGVESLKQVRKKVDEIALHIVKEHLKSKIPLFVIGAGISRDLIIPEKLIGKVETMGVPTMSDILEKLYLLYGADDKSKIPTEEADELRRHFEVWRQQVKKGKKIDRAIVGGILGYFQDKESLREIWISFNNWLLDKCVSGEHNIGIIDAPPSDALNRIADLYQKVDAICLTTNFDGLLLKSLHARYPRNHVFSYYTPDQVRSFFTRETPAKATIEDLDYVEIQVRGDIFFAKCDPKWCEIYDKCELPKEIYTFSQHIQEMGSNPLQCPKSPEIKRKPFVSFPGSLEKDKEIRGILEVLWEYLAHRLSCVITVGLGGWWDPVLVAFLSDLSRDREIPFVDINTLPERSYISKEIVASDSSLRVTANQFMIMLNESVDEALHSIEKTPIVEIRYSREPEGEDKFWDAILREWEISDLEKELLRHPMVEITNKFAQLGLKSKWWGIQDEDRWYHSRLNHSKGVMKIASFLYEQACQNSGRPKRTEEKQFLRVAALLHDIGHLPFSHLIEEVIRELNWKPAGYIESFTHDYHTEEKVKRIFGSNNLREKLGKLGYSVPDLIRLINGEFGVGFMDAIINGPIDADKIDYVFRDAQSTGVFPHLIEPGKFLDQVARDISISSVGLLVLKEISAEAAFNILQQRERLYRDFYLHPAVRLLEKALKFLIITYFVHTYNTLEIQANIRDKLLNSTTQFSDLGAIRIEMASEELERLVETHKTEPDIEMRLVQHFKETIDKRPIDGRVRKAIEKCYDFITSVNRDTECRALESEMRQDFAFPRYTQKITEKIVYDAKTVTLRFPGAILIDVLPEFEFFKIPAARRRKARSDGTNVQSESILCPELLQMIDQRQHARREVAGQINVYRIGEENECNRALRLFEDLLQKERVLEEVE